MSIQLKDYLHDALDKITHTSTVESFYHQFEAIKSLLVASQPEIPEAYFSTRFSYGLLPELQAFVLRFNPVTMISAYRLACIYEESIYLDYFPESIMQNDDCSVENSVAENHLDVPYTDKACKDAGVENFSSVSTSFFANSEGNDDTSVANISPVPMVQEEEITHFGVSRMDQLQVISVDRMIAASDQIISICSGKSYTESQLVEGTNNTEFVPECKQLNGIGEAEEITKVDLTLIEIQPDIDNFCSRWDLTAVVSSDKHSVELDHTTKSTFMSKELGIGYIHTSSPCFIFSGRHLTFSWEPGHVKLKIRDCSDPNSIMTTTTKFSNNADTFHKLQSCGENVIHPLLPLESTNSNYSSRLNQILDTSDSYGVAVDLSMDNLSSDEVHQQSIASCEVVHLVYPVDCVQLLVGIYVKEVEESVGKSPSLEITHNNEVELLFLKEHKENPPDVATRVVDSIVSSRIVSKSSGSVYPSCLGRLISLDSDIGNYSM